jgi:hypothetical protein
MQRLLMIASVLLAGCAGERAPDVARDSSGRRDPVAARDSVSAPASKPDLLRLDQPRPNAVITSPLLVEGEARGPWFFEASFPVYLLSSAGDTIAVQPAQAKGEWMTTEFVPFSTTLTFTTPGFKTGTLILAKDNPSGLPEHADELRVPIRFH